MLSRKQALLGRLAEEVQQRRNQRHERRLLHRQDVHHALRIETRRQHQRAPGRQHRVQDDVEPIDVVERQHAE
jgi:hypothetical protein